MIIKNFKKNCNTNLIKMMNHTTHFQLVLSSKRIRKIFISFHYHIIKILLIYC